MKTRIIALLLFLCPCLFAQQAKNLISMTTKSMADNTEMLDLMRFNNIEYYKVKFAGEALKGKNYTITVKEMWNGKLKSTDTIFNSTAKGFSFLGKLNSDTLSFRVMATKSDAKKLKLSFYFDRLGITKEYKCINSNDYSLRDVGTEFPIVPNKPFYAFAYILPFELKNGNSSWCVVDSSGKDIENWGKEFGIKHYLLFEMNFFD